MKRLIVFWIGVLLAGILLVGITLVLIVQNEKNRNIDMNVLSVSQVNFNNYIVDNTIDYKETGFAWQNSKLLGSKLMIMNSNEQLTTVSGVVEPFQLVNDGVLFLKRGTLIQVNLENKQKNTIAENVSRFVAVETYCYYLSEGVVYQYNYKRQTAEALKENTNFIYVYKELLYVIDQNGCLMRYEGGVWKDLCQLQISRYPFYVMPQNDEVVFVEGNALQYVNVYTGKKETISLLEGAHSNNRICYICDDSELYVSIQATKTDGSIVKNVDDANNGTWRVDYSTKELYRLCDDTFEQLYLFEGNQLFGEKNGYIYKIDTESGVLRRII